MPKILINEVDNTSAGAPGRYGNYSVLLTGYAGTPDAKESNPKKPDSNGVYEFNSKGEFLATIGDADTVKKDSQDNTLEYHYGNKMAQELLGLGYTVIYKVIDRVADMNSESFWEIFKDKASYDFRFISHGMLESCYDAVAHTALYDRINQIKADIAELERIKDTEAPDAELSALTFDDIVKCDIPYQKHRADKTRYVDNEGLQYATFALAVGYEVDEDNRTCTFVKDSGLYGNLISKTTDFDKHNKEHFTITTFNNINGWIASLANYMNDDRSLKAGRGDCIALIELDEDTYYETGSNDRPEALIINGIKGVSNAIGTAGKYCAMTVPSVHYYIDGVKTMKMPGAFHYLACFMNSLQAGFAEWYAAAGYTRGVSNYAIDHTSVKLGEIAINTLEPRSTEDFDGTPMFACNVIANFRGSYYLWGNRTAAAIEKAGLTADHFLNIRQLCTTIKKQLYVACRRFTFDPNSDTLWFNFVNAITPTLDVMKADQGIRDYKVVKVAANKKATLKAKIRIIPIEAVEDFDIEVSLEDSFGETAVTAV
jgi:hypothetical protein